MPTASEYFKYVSIDATTTRASTVTRSMPTSETRTQASMTMPLSSTRSRTSMRELPLGVRSTAMVVPSCELRFSTDHDLRDDLEAADAAAADEVASCADSASRVS